MGARFGPVVSATLFFFLITWYRAPHQGAAPGPGTRTRDQGAATRAPQPGRHGIGLDIALGLAIGQSCAIECSLNDRLVQGAGPGRRTRAPLT